MLFDLVLRRFFVVYSRLRTAVFHNQDQELDCESATLDGYPEYVLYSLGYVVDTRIIADSLLVLDL